MISYNFDYFQPTSVQEAVDTYFTLLDEGKNPVYFSGGTEIITLGRVNKITTDAVIDIKKIPECQIFQKNHDFLILGAALPLSYIEDKNKYPLLDKVIAEIADHTARNKITLGGNICANIIYREAVLPLLLTDSKVVIATREGLLEKPINDIFHKSLQLHDGEVLIQLKVDTNMLKLPFYTVKKRRQWGVGYPLITIAAVEKEGEIRTAFSGLCEFPFRSLEMEKYLNDHHLGAEDRIAKAMKHIPGEILDDVHGTAEYREFVLKNILLDSLHALESGDK